MFRACEGSLRLRAFLYSVPILSDIQFSREQALCSG